MKNLFATLFLIAFSLNMGMTSSNTIIDGDDKKPAFEFKMNANYGDVVSVVLNEKDNALSFSTLAQISFVQILDSEGRVEYQLPVFSNDVIIDLDDFESGKFQINLLVENDEMISSTFQK